MIGRNEWTTAGEVNKQTKTKSREMYSPMQRNTRKQQYTSAFDKIVFFGCKKIDRQQNKKEAKKTIFVKTTPVLLFLCVYRRIGE